MKEKEKVIFDETDSVVIREALNDFLANLKINGGSRKRIQLMQQIIDKLPKSENNWALNAK
tara:strand:- start:250 stop:432 length:183 start_codon:yes stop_codon:yes gene_type:complete